MTNARILTSFALLSLFASGCGDDHGGTSSSAVSGGTTGNAVGANATPPAATPAGGYRFFLPTPSPDNTSPPMVLTDSIGNVHAVYPAYAKGGAYYAYCGTGCTDTSGVKVVRFETPDGTATNTSLALDAQNHPRVLINAFRNVYYATCDDDCGEQASWTVSAVLDHGDKYEVSGEALALDPQGRPRFSMHTYRTYLGIGQGAPETFWVSCDANCSQATSWSSSRMQTDIIENGQLRIDASGKARLGAVSTVTQGDAKVKMAAYLECSINCGAEAGWTGIGLGEVFTSEYDAFAIKPAVALATTKSGNPRIALLGKSKSGDREIHYLECNDANCTEDHWKGQILSTSTDLGAGLDLALDANDAPRLAYTLGWNIALASCNSGDCTAGGNNWGFTKVEMGDEMPPDQIFLYPNCNVSAWFLMSPSIAISPSGEVRVGYQARDASGGLGHPDTPNTDCVAGTDMAWDRIAFLPAVK